MSLLFARYEQSAEVLAVAECQEAEGVEEEAGPGALLGLQTCSQDARQTEQPADFRGLCEHQYASRTSE